MAVTPDGRIALSGDTDGAIRVWDLQQGRELHLFVGHDSYVTALAVTPDGATAVSGGYDATVRAWDLNSGSPGPVLKGHPESIFSLAITPDGRRAASGCRKTMRVWDLVRGIELGSVGHRGNGLDVTIASDGVHAICQGKKGILRMALDDGHLESPIKVKWAGRYFKALSPDARLALTEASGTLTKWDVPSGRSVREFAEHESSIQGLALSPDARHAATASSDETIRIWDLESEEVLAVVRHPTQVRCVAITPDARLAVSGGQDRIVRVWDLTQADVPGGTTVDTGHPGGVSSLAILPDGRLVATAGGGVVRIWDLARPELPNVIDTPAVRVAFAGPDRLLSAGWKEDPVIRVWSMPGGELLDVWEGHRNGIGALAASPDGHYAVSAGYDLSYRLWDVRTGEEIWFGHGRTGLSDEGMAAAFSPDGRRALVGCWNGMAKVLDVPGRTEKQILDWHFLDHDALARRPDLSTFGQSTMSLLSDIAVDGSGALWVSASADRTARVWELATGRCRWILPHVAPVRGVAIDSEGRLVVSACEDLTVRVWDVRSGEVVAAFTADAEFTCCAMSRDGREIAAGDAAGRIHFLRLEAPPN